MNDCERIMNRGWISNNYEHKVMIPHPSNFHKLCQLDPNRQLDNIPRKNGDDHDR